MMKTQQVRIHSCFAEAQKKQRDMVRGGAGLYGQADLACLRIERNRAVRHARGAIAKFTFPQ